MCIHKRGKIDVSLVRVFETLFSMANHECVLNKVNSLAVRINIRVSSALDKESERLNKTSNQHIRESGIMPTSSFDSIFPIKNRFDLTKGK